MTDKLIEDKPNKISDSLPVTEISSEKDEMREIRSLIMQSYSGPLPHPSILKQYEEIMPGSADRILSQFERQTKHRHAIEKRDQEHIHAVEREELRNTRIQIKTGQYLGFSICVLLIVGAVICALKGALFPSGILGSAGLIGLAAVFIYGSRKKNNKTENLNPEPQNQNHNKSN